MEILDSVENLCPNNVITLRLHRKTFTFGWKRAMIGYARGTIVDQWLWGTYIFSSQENTSGPQISLDCNGKLRSVRFQRNWLFFFNWLFLSVQYWKRCIWESSTVKTYILVIIHHVLERIIWLAVAYGWTSNDYAKSPSFFFFGYYSRVFATEMMKSLQTFYLAARYNCAPIGSPSDKGRALSIPELFFLF